MVCCRPDMASMASRVGADNSLRELYVLDVLFPENDVIKIISIQRSLPKTTLEHLMRNQIPSAEARALFLSLSLTSTHNHTQPHTNRYENRYKLLRDDNEMLRENLRREQQVSIPLHSTLKPTHSNIIINSRQFL